MSPALQTFHLGWRFYQNIFYLLICGDILENHFPFLDLIMKNVMLYLNVLWYVMEHWFSLKDSCISDHYNIYHGRIQHLYFLLSQDIMERLKLKHIQVALFMSS
jgi:hypothetical protein